MNKASKNIVRRVLLVLLGLVLGFNVYMFNANTVAHNSLPMPFGIGCAVVQSGSMEPTYSVGDMLFVKQKSQYSVGDVVVYQSQGDLVVHRITAIQGNSVTTQGDANNMSDAPFEASNIKGVVVGCIPVVGYAVDALKTPFGILIILALAILLIELSFRRDHKNSENDEKANRIRAMREEIEQLKGSLDADSAGSVSSAAGKSSEAGKPSKSGASAEHSVNACAATSSDKTSASNSIKFSSMAAHATYICPSRTFKAR